MNKSFIKSGLVVIAALVLASCSKTEEFQHNPDSALQIESVSGISPFALTTKAVITGNTLPDSDAATGIGIFVTASDGGAYDGHDKGYTNVNFANSGSGWSTATPVYLSDTEGKLYGYFPYNSNANDLRAIPVQSSLNGTDYLYAETQTVNHSNKTVSLQMNHALSRLHLTIKKGENFTADAPLSKITLTSTAIDATGTMDLTTGAITASKKSGETGTVELPTDGTITAEGIEKDILLVPAVNSEGKKDISISLMIDGKPAGITLSGENGLDIRSGIQNNVTLTIEDTGIKVSGIGVGEWGEGYSQEVQVGGHTVTVSVDEAGGTPYDILVRAYTDGDVAKVEAFAKSGKALFCSIAGTATCAHTKTDNIYTFTISNITSNVAAKIGYQNAESISLDRTTVNPAKGWVVHLTATVAPSDAINKKVAWSSNHSDIASVDGNGNVTAVAQGEASITATTTDGSGISATCTVTVGPAIPTSLSHEFSVSATKKVHFSKGNLWAEAGSNTLHFESNQWQFDSDLMLSSHKSYFEWSTAISNTSNDSYIFCDENHKQAVDGSDDIYYVLSLDEWRYLLNIDRNEYIRKDKCKLGVTVCGLTRCLVIAPDDWDISTMPLQASYDEASWKNAEDAGLVCLPAAGNRSEEVVFVDGVGLFGSYWSSSTESNKKAYDIQFDEDFHYYPNQKGTDRCLRLVTDVK